MRTIGCCIIVLVLVLMCFGIASANPGGGVKSSPLFKASLEKSIAKLEGKIEGVSAAGNQDEDMPTGKRICPNLPLTQQTTCEPSWCGGATCYGEATCSSTCSETCWSTCSGTTCQGTCTSTCQGPPVNCVFYDFDGYAKWVIGSQYGFNWNSLPYPYSDNGPRNVYVLFSDDQQSYFISNFLANGGYFDGGKLHPQFDGGAVVWAENWIYSEVTHQATYGSGQVGLDGPLSYTSTNSAGVIEIVY